MNIKWRFELDENGDLIDNLSKLNYLHDDEWEDKKKFIDIINTLHQENQSVFKSINSKIRFSAVLWLVAVRSVKALFSAHSICPMAL